MARSGKKESIQPPATHPDPGFDYNPGMVKWKPDLNKYAPEARRIIGSANLGAPTNIAQLGDWLTRARDSMRQAGLQASDAPITIKPGHAGSDGAIDYQTGEMWLARKWINAIDDSLKAGKVLTQDQMDAFEVLVNAFGHHLGSALQPTASDQGGTLLAQVINDLWARHKTPNFLGMFGMRYDRSLAARLVEYHPTAYQLYVERLRSILRAVGISEAEEIDLITRLNLSVDPVALSDEMWRVIQARKPGLRLPRSFGDYLWKEGLYRDLMDRLNG